MRVSVVDFVTGADPIHKATVMPRGRALGMVMQLPDGDQTSMSRRQMLARLDVCMGGRVAEEVSSLKQQQQHLIALRRGTLINTIACVLLFRSSMEKTRSLLERPLTFSR